MKHISHAAWRSAKLNGMEVYMNILVFGGFLGSGKTTVIRAFIEALQAQEQGPIVIVENEIGEIGIDDHLLASQGVTVKSLVGGCVCCEIRGNLLQAVAEIHASLSPPWLMIELTGLAVLPNIVNALRDHADDIATTYVVSVVDAGRWEKLYCGMSYFVHAQLSGCDALVLNKTDLCDMPEEMARALIGSTGVEEIVCMARDTPRTALCEQLLLKLVAGATGDPVPPEDDTTAVGAGSLDAGAVNWEYRLEGEVTCDTMLLRRTLDSMFRALGNAYADGGAVFGHIKGILKQENGGYLQLSTTRPDIVDMQASHGWRDLAAPESLTLTLAVICANRTSDAIQALAAPVLREWEALGAHCIRHALDRPHAHDHHVSTGRHAHPAS